jgi:hypothetical protein
MEVGKAQIGAVAPRGKKMQLCGASNSDPFVGLTQQCVNAQNSNYSAAVSSNML